MERDVLRGVKMQRLWVFNCILLLIGLLCGCTPPEAAQPEATPNPLAAYCGQWTAETGDGSIVWDFREDGTVVVPEQAVDRFRSIGGMGTWTLTDEGLSVMLAEPVELRLVTEDGFTKLHCPLLNDTLVRTHERETAYGAKFVDVELTDETVWDWFALKQVDAPVDEKGERIWKEVFVMTSPVYEQGLVYWDERGVEVDFVYWTTYELQADKAPYGVSFYVDDFNSVTARGTLTFVREDHVAAYVCDGRHRTVTLNDGASREETFQSFRYDGYPY